MKEHKGPYQYTAGFMQKPKDAHPEKTRQFGGGPASWCCLQGRHAACTVLKCGCKCHEEEMNGTQDQRG